MQHPHPTGDATLPEHLGHTFAFWLARAIHRRVRFNKNHGADLLDPVILPFGPDGTGERVYANSSLQYGNHFHKSIPLDRTSDWECAPQLQYRRCN
jgi:hypothetical protein